MGYKNFFEKEDCCLRRKGGPEAGQALKPLIWFHLTKNPIGQNNQGKNKYCESLTVVDIKLSFLDNIYWLNVKKI